MKRFEVVRENEKRVKGKGVLVYSPKRTVTQNFVLHNPKLRPFLNVNDVIKR